MAKTKGKRGRPKKEAEAPVKPHGKKGRPALPKSERINYKIGDTLRVEFAGGIEEGELRKIELPKWGGDETPFYIISSGGYHYPVKYENILKKIK